MTVSGRLCTTRMMSLLSVASLAQSGCARRIGRIAPGVFFIPVEVTVAVAIDADARARARRRTGVRQLTMEEERSLAEQGVRHGGKSLSIRDEVTSCDVEKPEFGRAYTGLCHEIA